MENTFFLRTWSGIWLAVITSMTLNLKEVYRPLSDDGFVF